MTDDRRKRIEELFDAAIELASEARTPFLDEQCADDRELRASVQTLLDAHDRSSDFLDPPVPAAALNLLSNYTDEGMLGREVGPYRLTAVIASGGMGTVFKAIRCDDEDAASVAIKLIRPGMDSQDILRRFAHERETLAKLEHPGIARLLDGGMTTDGRPYLVMEYVEGVPITQYCDEQKLSVTERLELVRTVCAAIQHAHQNLIVHRDIKPSNVLVTPEGVPKLLDFGIAKLVVTSAAEAPTRTITALRFATPQYASPEVIRGESPSTSMDVYSLGVVLYELLSGHRPYEVRRQSLSELERTICEEDPELPSTVVTAAREITESNGTTRTIDLDAVSEQRGCTPYELRNSLRGDLDNVVFAALHKDPRRRYASVGRLSEDIERYLTGFPVRARKDAFGYLAGKFFRRHRVGVSVATLALLGLVVGAAGVSYGLVRATREAAKARLEAEKARQINTVLQGMLASANPEEGYRDMKVREVLDMAARTVDVDLAHQPDVLAAVQSTIGQSYVGLGLHAEAEPLLRSALEIRRGVHGEVHESVAESLSELGQAMTTAGAYDESEQSLNAALSMNRDLLGPDDPAVARTVAALGWLAYKRGDYPGAEVHFRQAVDIGRRALGRDDPDLSFALEKLGMMLAVQGEFVGAEQFCGEALEMNRRLFGEKHPRVSRGTRALAIVFQYKRAFEEAEPLYRKALELDRELLGNTHPSVARTLHNFGTLMHATGREEDAIPMLEEALAIRREAFGNEHLTVAVTLNNLATAKGHKAAEPYLRESLQIGRKVLGDDHPHVASTLQNLGAMHRSRGEYAEAEPLYREALSIYENLFGPEHMKVSYPLLGIGECMLHSGDAKGAEPFLRRAFRIRERVVTRDHPVKAAVHSALGACLTALEHYDEAERLLLTSYEVLAAHAAFEGESTRTVAERIVQLYEAWNKPEEAAKYRAPQQTDGAAEGTGE